MEEFVAQLERLEKVCYSETPQPFKGSTINELFKQLINQLKIAKDLPQQALYSIYMLSLLLTIINMCRRLNASLYFNKFLYRNPEDNAAHRHECVILCAVYMCVGVLTFATEYNF
ncbi:hypothetical protein GQX74_000833 [Glossina fuscipes]|nr:hypothetical protein GQX74_000833 [Glossina fuscipes]